MWTDADNGCAQGVNIMAFCKEYNAQTAKMAGEIIPVEITVYDVSWWCRFGRCAGEGCAGARLHRGRLHRGKSAQALPVRTAEACCAARGP
jgi:hypothetical protein